MAKKVRIFRLAKQFIKDQIGTDGTGADKADRVVDALIEHLDQAIHPDKPFAEIASDAALRWVLKPILKGIVKEAFDGMRKRGQL